MLWCAITDAALPMHWTLQMGISGSTQDRHSHGCALLNYCSPLSLFINIGIPWGVIKSMDSSNRGENRAIVLSNRHWSNMNEIVVSWRSWSKAKFWLVYCIDVSLIGTCQSMFHVSEWSWRLKFYPMIMIPHLGRNGELGEGWQWVLSVVLLQWDNWMCVLDWDWRASLYFIRPHECSFKAEASMS